MAHRYLIDKVNGVAYTNTPGRPKHVGSWNGSGVQLDTSKAAAVKRMEYKDETYLVDQSSGLVYTNDLQHPIEVGMWSAAGGIALFRAPEKKKKKKPAADSGMSEEEKRFMAGGAALPDGSNGNVNTELSTDVKAIAADVVYDDIPGSMGDREGNYQGMDPGWIDGQHKMLANFGWFRDDCKNDHAACDELADAEAGHFILRVVTGEELSLLPSKHHKGRPGNYAISVAMPGLASKVGIDAVYHFLVLPSWDPTGRAAGSTLYRIGIRSKKLFTSIPELIRYYSARAFHKQKVDGKKKKLKYRLMNSYPDPENYADLVVNSGAADFGFGSAPTAAYMDVGDAPNETYQDVSGGHQRGSPNYMDVNSNRSGAAYMDVKSTPSGAAYMDVKATPSGAAHTTVAPGEGGRGGEGQAAYMTVDTGANGGGGAIYQDVVGTAGEGEPSYAEVDDANEELGEATYAEVDQSGGNHYESAVALNPEYARIAPAGGQEAEQVGRGGGDDYDDGDSEDSVEEC